MVLWFLEINFQENSTSTKNCLPLCSVVFKDRYLPDGILLYFTYCCPLKSQNFFRFFFLHSIKKVLTFTEELPDIGRRCLLEVKVNSFLFQFHILPLLILLFVICFSSFCTWFRLWTEDFKVNFNGFLQGWSLIHDCT